MEDVASGFVLQHEDRNSDLISVPIVSQKSSDAQSRISIKVPF